MPNAHEEGGPAIHHETIHHETMPHRVRRRPLCDESDDPTERRSTARAPRPTASEDRRHGQGQPFDPHREARLSNAGHAARPAQLAADPAAHRAIGSSARSVPTLSTCDTATAAAAGRGFIVRGKIDALGLAIAEQLGQERRGE